MWLWIQENHAVISAIASVLTLVVWLFYFQILLNNYRHRLRPKILINMGAGHTLDAKCVVANMSAESIYIEAVIVTAEKADHRVVCSLSDLDTALNPDLDPRRQWFQGPLASAELIDLGSYRSLLQRVFDSQDFDDYTMDRTETMTVTVVGTYTGDDGLVAAERIFHLESKGGIDRVEPETWSTRQIRSAGQQRQLQKFLLQRNVQHQDTVAMTPWIR